MPRKAPSARIPAHLEDFLARLEAQALAGEDIDRVRILQEVEKAHGSLIDLDAELREHPDAQARFDRVWKRVTMGLEDASINRARAGKASATTLLRGMGAISTASTNRRGASGRLQLDRAHREKVSGYRSGW